MDPKYVEPCDALLVTLIKLENVPLIFTECLSPHLTL